ncbi:protein SCAR3 isoform X2 [Manihot esculenta]|uniref:Protein SCAR n=2 Tax=Manihot esculenta TaxID=3983 RepID=A0A2C9U560_MANES|nr:protein SCAR3 isoform X2 [Manihot esculenta]OAY24938.1 hypothetical protein MANES_17G055800v8 [Manihot esculenta]
MPLVRFEVRNEYRLGQPELYKEANREDPKAVLDGVAVAGLVGILRQLGDLAEFAAEVFHGLQEQVTTTASRSHKLKVRVQKIEAKLPSLEKAVLAQTSHIHLAYTAGSEWHSRIHNGQNHFISNDLPRFIMDSYEECRDPPRLHLLDKFDTGGPGSCLKRYSDPTFFRRASGNFNEPDVEKFPKEKKTRKTKKKRPSRRNADFLRSASMPNQSARMQYATTIVNGRTSSPTGTSSTNDMTLKSDLGDHSNSFDSRTGSAYVECVFHLSSSRQPEEHEPKEYSSRFMHHNDNIDSVFPDGQHSIETKNFPQSSSPEPTVPASSCDTWDEKAEIVETKGLNCDGSESPEMSTTDYDLGIHHEEIANYRDPDESGMVFDNEDAQKSSTDKNEIDEVESEPDNYEDALNTIESESENDLDCQTKRELEQLSSKVNDEGIEDEASKMAQHISVDFPAKSESYIASDISLKGMVSELPISVPSNTIVHEHASYISEEPSGSDISPKEGMVSEEPSGSDISPKEGMVSEEPSGSDISPKEGMVSEEPSGSDISPKEGIVSELPMPIPSDTVAHEHTSNTSKEPSVLDNIGSSTCADALDGSEVGSLVSDPSSSSDGISNLVEPLSEITASSACKPQESPKTQELAKSHESPESQKMAVSQESHKSQESQAELSSVLSVSFWTNGGLLGLEPSKPPDFAVSNASMQDSLARCKGEVKSSPNLGSMPSDNGERVRPGRLIKDDHFNSRCEDQDAESEKSGDFHHSNRFGSVHMGGLNGTSIAKPEKELCPDADVKSASRETSQENDENSGQMFGLGPRLLINGLRKTMSLIPDSKPEMASSQRSNALEQRNGHDSIAYHANPGKASNDKFGHKSIVDSLTSSPPLEHMKMSFHPIDGFEVSKLKLKVPDGNHSTGSFRDMFPSFQLVPEHCIPMQHAGSESDDDTFCRSSPYMSDDCLSHHSDSCSEQWEPGESPQNQDPGLYDALCRISSVESVSSSLQAGEMGKNGLHMDSGLKSEYTENGADPSLHSLLDLPSFDAVSPVLQEKENENLDPRNLIELHNPKECNPVPPPPPPVQWWVTKPASYVAEEKQNIVSDTVSEQHIVDLKLSGSIISQQHKPAPAKKHQTVEEALKFKPNNKDHWKLNAQGEVSVPPNGKGMDEKEDFLHQIKTKSFTLRRTVTAKPTFASGPAANDKVSAILEKANAIRQAVGSDDGEDDDTWSDT